MKVGVVILEITNKKGVDISKSLVRMMLVEYEQEMSEYAGEQRDARQERNDWKENGPKIWNLLITHCPKSVITRLEAQADFGENKKQRDPIQLLIMLRDISQAHDSTKNETMAIVESDMNLMLGFQGKTDPIEAFL